jgi:uncharacterized protein HemX
MAAPPASPVSKPARLSESQIVLIVAVIICALELALGGYWVMRVRARRRAERAAADKASREAAEKVLPLPGRRLDLLLREAFTSPPPGSV